MLLRFGISNYRSLWKRQEISFVASSLDDRTEGLIACRPAPGGKVLPALVVYGANASGKSNLVDALRWMRNAVLYSHSRGEPGGGVTRTPFALDPGAAVTPTQCDADFVVDSIRYHYGFEATDEAFTREWLFAFPHERRQMLFEREGEIFSFGRGLKGRNQTVADLTRPNSLFLSAATQNAHEDLTRIAKFFQTISVQNMMLRRFEENLRFQNLDERIIRFLGSAGTGIIDYRVREHTLSNKTVEFGKDLQSILSKLLEVPLDSLLIDNETTQLQLAHRDTEGKPVYLELAQESEGTRRLLSLLTPVFQALDAGTPIIVDELDASLHTQACELVLALFASPLTNPKGAQLLATTHDTNLLASPDLRRDQVWLTEKDQQGATHLYPLTDFRTRKGDNLARGYLQGRYGAIPFAGRAADLLKVS